jgi:hypothetical protein
VIVRRIAGSAWLFDQDEHGRLSGDLAAAWGSPPFAPVPEFVRDAAATHDSGWAEWDRVPRLDPETGLPHPYSRMPATDYHEIWVRGLARAWGRGPGVGLFVSLHAMRFFSSRSRAADRALLASERSRQAEAMRWLGYTEGSPEHPPDPLSTWHEWFFFWDALSLLLCEGWASPWRKVIPSALSAATVEMVVHRADEAQPGGVLWIEPWPFSAPLELSVAARSIPDRRYAMQAELDESVTGAARRTVRWKIGPRGDSRSAMIGPQSATSG